MIWDETCKFNSSAFFGVASSSLCRTHRVACFTNLSDAFVSAPSHLSCFRRRPGAHQPHGSQCPAAQGRPRDRPWGCVGAGAHVLLKRLCLKHLPVILLSMCAYACMPVLQDVCTCVCLAARSLHNFPSCTGWPVFPRLMKSCEIILKHVIVET